MCLVNLFNIYATCMGCSKCALFIVCIVIFKMKLTYLFIIVVLLCCFDLFSNNEINVSVVSTCPSILLSSNLINWKMYLLDILTDVNFFDAIVSDSVLLVNIVRNNTNGFLQTIKITNTLIELITKNTDRYNVISMEQLYHAYRELEISLEEISNSYEFAVKIANYLRADYIIYSIVYENSQYLNLELQLIFTKTGEIIHVINKCL